MPNPNTVNQGHTKKQHVFAEVPTAEIQRSSFDRSHGLKTTFSSMQLVPIFVDEALPGDTFNLNATLLARLATPIKPVMDNLYIDTFFFAVPYRLVWSDWQRFNGEQTNPGDSTVFTIPTATSPAGGYLNSSLQDYMGIPTQVAGITHSNLWPRAYNLIWNQWFRDENLQNSVTVDIGDGPDNVANYVLLNRGKRHDYFTSCLPWPQKGTAVSLSLGTSAPIDGTATGTITSNTAFNGIFYDTTNSLARTWQTAASGPPYDIQQTAGTAAANVVPRINANSLNGSVSVPSTGLTADLSSATSVTINSMRLSFQIQKLLERDARGGTRYTEVIRAHFGVVSPDARLQRPEFLGGGSQRISVLPVPQTAPTVSAQTPQGNLAAYGVGVSSRNGFTKSFTEHCLLIGLCAVRADITYQQGLNRMWSRSTRYDFYWPSFAHLGEQAVLNIEIYAQGTAGGSADAAAFGYQERYAEMRYKPSMVTGEFRSNFAQPLDFWHLADYYTSLPTLGATWISTGPPMARIEAVTTGPDWLLDAWFQMKCARPMPLYGVPGMIDRF